MAEQSPEPWRATWRYATSNETLVVLLVAIALGTTLSAWIPQQPLSDVDYARWLSEMQARFGEATSVLQILGLFTITSSIPFRALLAFLAGVLVLRLIEGVEQLREGRVVQEPDDGWKELPDCDLRSLIDDLRGHRYRVRRASSLLQVDRWPWSGVLRLVAHVGALFLLLGLLLFDVAGWQMSDLILLEGEPASLRGGQEAVTLRADGRLQHSPGLVAFLGERGPGVRVNAFDAEGEPLELLLTPDADPHTELQIAVTGEAYFAIPAAELIVRLAPQSGEAYSRLDVQIYNSPTGDIIAERVTDKGGHGEFDVASVNLIFASAPFARATAVCNPGRWPAALGLLLLILGLIGSLLWPERRFWVRETESAAEGMGALPSWMVTEGEEP